MRKPLVVVCAAASAVLIGGAILATTAGAETAPAESVAAPVEGLPDVPGVPGLPQVPAGGGAPAADLADLIDQAQSQSQAQAAGSTSDEAPAADPPADKPARPAADEPADKPAPQRPGGQDDRDDAKDDQRPVRQQQRPAFGAQQNVTPANVSGSVDAPVQRSVLSLVNENRRRGGCGNLTLDRRLIAAANRHAADMARRGFFAHDSPNGDGAGDRVEDAGYRWSRYGENIARGQETAGEVVNGWMNSPSHRENIMDCGLEQMGIGLAFDGDEAYWVQDFATPKN